jgi:hypothetical protein
VTFLLGIWWGKFVGTLRGSLGCESPPKSVSKGARFWGFPSSRVRGVLGGISSIPPWGPGASQWSMDDRSSVMSDWQRTLDWLLA